MTVFNIIELYVFKMFTAANQMLHEFYHKNKKNEKNKSLPMIVLYNWDQDGNR